jgi:hypothetical protein
VGKALAERFSVVKAALRSGQIAEELHLFTKMGLFYLSQAQ